MEAQIDYTLERFGTDANGKETYKVTELTITGDVEAYHPATWHQPEEGGNAYITKIVAGEKGGTTEYDESEILTPEEIEEVEGLLYTAAEEDDSHCDHRW